MIRSIASAIALSALAAPAMAVINPFTETFNSGGASWLSGSTGTTPVTTAANGGPDGSAYVTGQFGFATVSSGQTPIFFRGTPAQNASGGAFIGNWPGAGVDTFSYSVRHNFTSPVSFFARFLAVGSFTGVVRLATVQPNTWTDISFNTTNIAGFIVEAGPPQQLGLFNSTFANVGTVQFGVQADAAIAGQAGPFTFDIDNVAIVPAPGAAALLGLGGLVATRRRRN